MTRNYDEEYRDDVGRQYAYDFDHRLRVYMMRTFEPFLGPGKALEIGCFEGEMTRVIHDYVDDLTVLEAAASLIEVARARVPDTVRFVHATIEDAELAPEYESIFLVHTLEHLDDPVGGLARIRQWLSPTGRLYLVVPNAFAASRQLAVKMGLIETNQSVTPPEAAHGHRCTYSFDTLEHHARSAGLDVVFRGGVFFKPLANFQFDRLIADGLLDEGYLEGCFALGQQYPELSASIYLICGRGAG